MAPVTILHLTDLHFGWGTSTTQSAERTLALRGLLDALGELPPRWKPGVICISGDIGWRGHTDDYADAKKWVTELLSRLTLSPGDVLVCPGNHDVDRKIAARHARPADPAAADRCLQSPIADVPTVGAFAAFSAFCKDLGFRAYALGTEESYLVGATEHRGVRFLGCNSAWHCQGDDDQKKLWVGLPFLRVMEAGGQAPKVSDPDAPPTVCLIHHPPDWWHDGETHADVGRPNTQDYLAHRCHLILSGHTHGEVRKADRIAQSALHLTGGSSFAGAAHFNSFRVIRLEGNHLEYRSFEFDPRSPENAWQDRWEVQRLPFVERPPERSQVAVTNASDALTHLRDAARRSALRTVEQKSRQIKPAGELPQVQALHVALRVTEQVPQFDERGRLTQPKDATATLPLWEACHVSGRRRTVLLGDLGSGKTTLAARLVGEILDRESHTFALMVEAKSLRLPDSPTPEDVLTAAGKAFRAGVAGGCPEVDLLALLGSGQDIFLVIDGLDEVSRLSASRLLRQCEVLTETWPTIRLLATGRPIELAGVGYQSWTLCQFDPLRESDRLRLLEAEARAAGVTDPAGDARQRLAELKEQPALDDIATTPLAVRLLYPKLGKARPGALTLGNLLYDLLIERLGGWDEKDAKDDPHTQFLTQYPTAETRAPLLGEVAIAAKAPGGMTAERAVETLRSAAGLTQALAQEALKFFERVGLVSGQTELTFAFQPLLDVGVGVAWIERSGEAADFPAGQLPTYWRGIAFAAATARRRGSLDRLRPRFERCLAVYLQDAAGIPAAASLVSEAQDSALARVAVASFRQLGRKPIWGGRADQSTSLRAVADTIRLAGDHGFDWFFADYLDPRYPIVHRGSIVPESLLKQWVWLSRDTISDRHRDALRPLVAPMIRCGGLIDLLPALAHVVPDAFPEAEYLWYLAGGLGDKLSGEAAERLIRARATTGSRAIVRDVLCRRPSPRAIGLFLELFGDEVPPAAVLKGAVRWRAREPESAEAEAAEVAVRKKVGDESWGRLLRWLLSDPDRDGYLAQAASVLLYDGGERRPQVVGIGLLSATYSSFPGAERRLEELVGSLGEAGSRWLLQQMVTRKDFLGGHESWWRLLLRRLEQPSPDAPALLCEALPLIGPFLLSRYPEVRHGFQRLLAGPRGKEFHQALRQRLLDPDPWTRHAAACVLMVADPCGEAEALFECVAGRRQFKFESMEWEPFCLTLAFGPSVLEYLHGRLRDFGREERAFALAILHRNRFSLSAADTEEFFGLLLDSGNWNLRVGQDGRSLFASEAGYQFLAGRLGNPPGNDDETAQLLLEFHSTRLNETEKAKCWSRALRRRVYHPEPAKTQLLRVLDDPAYREELRRVHAGDDGERASLLAQASLAAEAPSGWEGLVWSLLCANRGFLGETEDAGEVLLDLGRERPAHAAAIGASARKWLLDPRVESDYRAETRHWLALLANEFGGLPTSELDRHAVRGTVHVAAQRALLARMGRIPDEVPRRQYPGDCPACLGSGEAPPKDRQELLARLVSYGRPGDQLHPDTCNTIEAFLFHAAASEVELAEIVAQGGPGCLIAEALRFCHARTPRVADQVALAGGPGFPEVWRDNPCFGRLRSITTAAREVVLSGGTGWKEEYATKLGEALRREPEWLAPLAIAFLQAGGNLGTEEAARVFEDYARNHGTSHAVLGRLLVAWPGLLAEERREQTLASARRAIGLLLRWDRLRTGRSPYPYLLFPLVEFALSRAARDEAVKAYLQGLTLVFADYAGERGTQRGMTVLADFEPLLQHVPDPVWQEIGKAVLGWHEPAVRNLFRLVNSLSGLIAKT